MEDLRPLAHTAERPSTGATARKTHPVVQRTDVVSLSQAECRRRQISREWRIFVAGDNTRALSSAQSGRHLEGGVPSRCGVPRPGDAYAQRVFDAPTELLNITSRCVRSGNRRDFPTVTQCRVMLCRGFFALTRRRRTDPARSLIAPPSGRLGGHRRRGGRTQFRHAVT